MKRCFVTTLIQLTVVLVLAMLPSTVRSAVRADGLSENVYNYVQLLRSDMNSIKVDLINSIMKLSADDAKKFWPVYQEYENELSKLAINRTELVAEFVQAHKDGSFDNEKAKDIAKRWFKNQRDKLDLLEKYHGKIQEALSPVQAGQFLQIENQLGLFVDVAIASEMPTVEAKAKSERP
jgi:hypothetical protein